MTPNSYNVLLLIGANQGDRFVAFETCRELIANHVGTILSVSPIYETSAWGKRDQADFINQGLMVSTSLSPKQLLTTTKRIEVKLGKNKITHWGPRHIDIDIILYEDLIVETKDLMIPHPHMSDRRFVLIPLNQIASTWIHPIKKMTIGELLKQCEDNGVVKEIERRE